MKRILVIGDIHGAKKALEQVLERAAVTDDDDLIFLGDYTDGYPDVAPLIDMLIRLPNKKVFIRGNHDQWTIDWMKKRYLKMDEHHFNSGGEATFRSYMNGDHPRIDEHLEFLQATQKMFVDDKDRVYVHGGWIHDPITDSIETVMWDRSLLEKALSADSSSLHVTKVIDDITKKQQIPRVLMPWSKIFIGHTSTTNWQTTKPIKACNLIDLDTGCGWRGGCLTIMDAATEEYWQSDPIGQLYPNAPGR